MLDAAQRLVRELGLGAWSAVVDPARRGEVSDKEPRLRSVFDEHGWLLIRNVLSQREVESIKHALRSAHARGATGDVALLERAGELVTDRRVVDVVKKLLGEKVAWFGDASWSWIGDSRPGAIGFHKDNADKDDAFAPDWHESEYPVIRVGFYFQDYGQWSGGLGLRDGSHKTASCLKGVPFAAPTAPGDMVIWSLRTTHSGFVAGLRWPRRWFVPLPIQSRINFRNQEFRPLPLFRPPPPDSVRPTMFLTYGRQGPLLDRYLAYLSTRRFAVQNWQSTRYSAQDVTRFMEAGLELIDMPTRVSEKKLEELNEEHAPIPY